MVTKMNSKMKVVGRTKGGLKGIEIKGRYLVNGKYCLCSSYYKGKRDLNWWERLCWCGFDCCIVERKVYWNLPRFVARRMKSGWLIVDFEEEWKLFWKEDENEEVTFD